MKFKNKPGDDIHTLTDTDKSVDLDRKIKLIGWKRKRERKIKFKNKEKKRKQKWKWELAKCGQSNYCVQDILVDDGGDGVGVIGYI